MARHCSDPGCDTQPVFNVKGKSTGLYCTAHKKDDMIDVVSKRCIESGCDTQPNYNVKGKTKALYCTAHKKDDMIDVVSKRCIESGCDTRPVFNIKGKTKALYCTAHKKDDMIDVVSKRCIESGCVKQPVFNIKGKTKALYCTAHKKDDMIDVKHKRCIGCDLFIVSNRTGFLCSYCNPIKQTKRKTKENSVRDHLAKLGIGFIQDKQISGQSCVKYRPDFLIEQASYFVIIECDEHAHDSYARECEVVRMNNITLALGLPVKWIRYNPDLKGVRTKEKLKVLGDTVTEFLNCDFLNDLDVVYLFY